jgi:hypothetical protein
VSGKRWIENNIPFFFILRYTFDGLPPFAVSLLTACVTGQKWQQRKAHIVGSDPYLIYVAGFNVNCLNLCVMFAYVCVCVCVELEGT